MPIPLKRHFFFFFLIVILSPWGADLMVPEREIVIPWYLCIWQQQLAVFHHNICWIQHAGSITVTVNWFHASAHRLPEIWTLREEPHPRTLTHWSLDVMMPINNFEHNLVVYILSIFSEIVPILTHHGLVTPYGDKDLGQHWLRLSLVAWQR